jgi:hypothetical protein
MIELTPGQAQDLEFAMQDADFELSQIRWDYSGRYMYGRTCIGITGSIRDLMRFVLLVMPKIVSELETGDRDVIPQVPEEWLDVRSDNMGMDMIFYWPEVQCPNPMNEGE